jgi:hypothetical protein
MGHKVATAAAAIRADISDLVGLVLLAASFVVLFVAAWANWPAVLIAALVVGVAADLRGTRRTRKIFEVLERSRFGAVERQVARDAALLLLLWRSARLPAATVAALAVAVVGSYAVVSTYLLVREYLQRIRALPVETRNVDLSALRLPTAPRPIWLLGDDWLVAPWAVSALGLILADLTGRSAYGFAGVIVSIVAEVAAVAVMLAALVRARHLRRRGWVFQTTRQALADRQPEVVLYHSGAPGSAYQVNMWLSTLEDLGRPAMVLLRQGDILSELEPTSLPVACVPSASDVMDLDLPSLRLALYVGNVAENVHLWRNGRLRHVFVGHGDSDKAASSNRVSRIYDQVWVAGPAGRERYRLSDSGVPDSAIVEVGRPQLRGIDLFAPPYGRRLTVLYAPTWEGWSDDMDLTSVPTMGVELVEQLLADPDVRVIYRPHPLAGTRSPALRAAHQRLVSRLTAAGQTVVGAEGPSLYDCFNQVDVLITDVSSLISEFIVSGKPYVVTNPGSAPDFVERYPTVAGGYLLQPGNGLAPILEELRGPQPDRMAQQREQIRHHLLGPSSADPLALFRTAVDALIGPPVRTIPAPRGASAASTVRTSMR